MHMHIDEAREYRLAMQLDDPLSRKSLAECDDLARCVVERDAHLAQLACFGVPQAAAVHPYNHPNSPLNM
ncbi:hypothetical protein GCM10025858_33250 [Alicyclobacillus sacchari]|uniref:hypothetical protein n=1 Tax=Alicyclobacillus sacchari TaxID=392010 RepID=UPI0023E94270|nr:hypothetical protein [Alicyclobacillus sacchari]GMA58822.1 hypothetical protein GCM10025858_33250 [Alicyclobacillus sacchari]